MAVKKGARPRWLAQHAVLLGLGFVFLLCASWPLLERAPECPEGADAGALASAASRVAPGFASRLPAALVESGIVTRGDAWRAHPVMAKLARGEPIVASAVGGSITFGHGTSSTYVDRTWRWLNATFPHAGHVLTNGALPAMTSEYMAPCVGSRIPPGVDLVLVEMLINDGPAEWRHAHRRSYERLLRTLLELPSRPLVVPLLLFNYHPGQHGGVFHRSPENEISTFSLYYGLPWLSTRQALFHATRLGLPGAERDTWVANDYVHLSQTGHEYTGDIVISYLRGELARLAVAARGEAAKCAATGSGTLRKALAARAAIVSAGEALDGRGAPVSVTFGGRRLAQANGDEGGWRERDITLAGGRERAAEGGARGASRRRLAEGAAGDPVSPAAQNPGGTPGDPSAPGGSTLGALTSAFGERWAALRFGAAKTLDGRGGGDGAASEGADAEGAGEGGADGGSTPPAPAVTFERLDEASALLEAEAAAGERERGGASGRVVTPSTGVTAVLTATRAKRARVQEEARARAAEKAAAQQTAEEEKSVAGVKGAGEARAAPAAPAAPTPHAWRAEDPWSALRALPPPMLPDLRPLSAQTCLVGGQLEAVSKNARGFAWEGQGGERRAVAHKAGSRIDLVVDTRGPEGSGKQGQRATAVMLFTTKSYHWAGDATVKCLGGCSCRTVRLRSAIHDVFATQDHLDVVRPTAAKRCILRVRTLNATDTGGHWFRVRAVALSADLLDENAYTELEWGEDLARAPPLAKVDHLVYEPDAGRR